MKVFISHSSKDKWLARKISEDLSNRDISTFLDEKDIQTGESIDQSVQEHLGECDESLILISPASLQSHWVLIELGGALALKKRIIPILIHVGVNQMPDVIQKRLARDINEIEKYYEEVSRRSTRVQKEEPQRLRRERHEQPKEEFREGDMIRLTSTPQRIAHRPGMSIDWKPEMNQFCGEAARIIKVDEDRSVLIDIDDGEYWWAFEWLTPIEKECYT